MPQAVNKLKYCIILLDFMMFIVLVSFLKIHRLLSKYSR